VRLLVDAQLPARLAALLRERGHDATHTSEMPDGNRSTDRQICDVADAADRIVVTKDADFRDGHLLHASPRRLLVVATGNISNHALLELVVANLPAIEHAYANSDHVELRHDGLVVHSR